MAYYSVLPHRALVSLTGSESATFLQGLVSNDMRKVERGGVIWAALLTPQGKFLHEFFVFPLNGVIYLECERERRDDLVTRLSRYKLRSKVNIAPDDDMIVGVAWGDGADTALGLSDADDAMRASDEGLIYRDPRLRDAGARWALNANAATDVLKTAGLEEKSPEDFDGHRLALGLPDGSRDLEIEKALLLESGFKELHGVDFNKGCYMGQELTARTHYRALIKKRLMPVAIEGDVPQPGTSLTANGKDAGEMKSAWGNHGLALVRLDVWKNAGEGPLQSGDAEISPIVPSWMELPGGEEDAAAQT